MLLSGTTVDMGILVLQAPMIKKRRGSKKSEFFFMDVEFEF